MHRNKQQTGGYWLKITWWKHATLGWAEIEMKFSKKGLKIFGRDQAMHCQSNWWEKRAKFPFNPED